MVQSKKCKKVRFHDFLHIRELYLIIGEFSSFDEQTKILEVPNPEVIFWQFKKKVRIFNESEPNQIFLIFQMSIKVAWEPGSQVLKLP